MSDNSHDISILNDLIATTIDSADGYSEAAKDAGTSRFASLFTSRAAERRGITGDLQRAVSSLGGTPEDDGTILAGAHRVFVNLKSMVTGQDEKALINEVEAGEDHIKAKYESALQDSALSPECRSLVQMAYGSVKSGHDQMRDLKHSLDS